MSGCWAKKRRQTVRGDRTPDWCAAHRSDITPPSAISWSLARRCWCHGASRCGFRRIPGTPRGPSRTSAGPVPGFPPDGRVEDVHAECWHRGADLIEGGYRCGPRSRACRRRAGRCCERSRTRSATPESLPAAPTRRTAAARPPTPATRFPLTTTRSGYRRTSDSTPPSDPPGRRITSSTRPSPPPPPVTALVGSGVARSAVGRRRTGAGQNASTRADIPAAARAVRVLGDVNRVPEPERQRQNRLLVADVLHPLPIRHHPNPPLPDHAPPHEARTAHSSPASLLPGAGQQGLSTVLR